MSRFWPPGWEEDYKDDAKICSSCNKEVFFIEWTNGIEDYIGGRGYASVGKDGEPDLFCVFFDDEQGWISDSHYVRG